jgi:hypothetical protein
MKNLPTFEEFLNESSSSITVKLTSLAAASMEKDLKANGVKFTKERPTVFVMDDSPKARTAIQLVKEHFGLRSIIVESLKNLPISEHEYIPNYKNAEIELKNYLLKKHPGFEMYPAYTDEIMVGFLRRPSDTTWDNVMTYYYNTNFELDEVSIKKVKI